MWFLHFSKITLRGVEDINSGNLLCLTSVFSGDTSDFRNSSLNGGILIHAMYQNTETTKSNKHTMMKETNRLNHVYARFLFYAKL